MAKTVVTLPRTSLTMDEGRVLAWHVKEGQAVNQGDPLCDLETDKATVELEAPVTGYVRRILAPAGEALPVGEPLAVLTETADEPLDDEPSDAAGAPAAGAAGGSAASAAAPAAAAAAADGAAALAPEAAAGPRWRASPAARRLARARGVDLAHVRGSGPAGRILRRDVEAALAAATPVAAPAPAPVAAAPVPAAAPHPAAAPGPAPAPAAQAATRAGRRVPLSPMRRAVARNMLASWQAAPQFSLTRDVDMTAVLELRRILAPSFAASRGVKLSPVDFLIQAAARALAAHPDLNATFTDEGLVHHDTVDVGLATATEDGGLLVPVVRGADRLTLVEIAARRQELVELARRGRLAPDAVGGTFTISNLGPFDVDRFHAIVQPGETAILAVGRIQERPAVREGQLCVRPLLTITLTVDHRAADGAAAARFLQDLVARLERDEGWLLF